MKTTLLIDGDAIAYRAAFIAGGQNASPRPLAAAMVRKLLGQLSADRAIVALSDPSRVYFRHKLFAGYKPNRSPQPERLPEAIEGFSDDPRVKVRMLPGLEADDVVGILATTAKLDGRKIIVGQDKDLLTIPGEHHRPVKHKGRETLKVSRAEAETHHLLQTLIGDSGDGYPGCRGVGEETANKIVGLMDYCESPLRVWQAVVETFIGRGFTEEDALLQARLARICRAGDYDMDTREVVPWTPPDAEYSVLLTVRDNPPATSAQQPIEPVPTSLFASNAAPTAGTGGARWANH